MKALLIIGAIASAWISGAGSGGGRNEVLGSMVFLFFAICCGLAAWSLR